MEWIKWFFGFVDYKEEEIAGSLSWQHLLFVSISILLMIGLAVWLGARYKSKDDKEKNKVLVVSAILIVSFELVKIVVACMKSDDVIKTILCNLLPLFLCSIQLLALPMAAFGKGRLKEASLDFVLIFGILGAIFGTVGAMQNYDAYPVLAFHNVVSTVTHCISGFASIYIFVSGMRSMKKENMWITFTILGVFCVVAYIVNVTTGLVYEGNMFEGSNYMFLMHHHGTPYSIFYNMVNGSPVFYPIIVVGIFYLYAAIMYFIPVIIQRKKQAKVKE